jgi:hypothetical protein
MLLALNMRICSIGLTCNAYSYYYTMYIKALLYSCDLLVVVVVVDDNDDDGDDRP